MSDLRKSPIGWRSTIGRRLLAAAVLAGTAAAAQQPCLRWEDIPVNNTPDDLVSAFAIHDDGGGPSLYAGGTFYSVGGVTSRLVARWDGAGWHALAGNGLGRGGFDIVLALTHYSSPGDGSVLVAGGNFDFIPAGGTTVHGIAKWGGAGWTQFGGSTAPGVHGSVSAFAVDGTTLYVGGHFDTVGGATARNVAAWTGTNWTRLGIGVGVADVSNAVLALAMFDDGGGPALYAGGRFSTAGGTPVRNLAKWDGAGWTPVGIPPFDGANDRISALGTFDDGSGEALYVAGSFSEAGGIGASHIVKWDGASWTPLGAGLSGIPGFSGSCETLTVFDDGSGPALIAGGLFSQAGSVSAMNVAKWDGANWSALGAGLGGLGDAALAACSFDSSMQNRALCVGGVFYLAGGWPRRNFASWDACTAPVTTFCFGDGTIRPCPCPFWGAMGHGCDNSQSTGGAQLASTGSTSPDSIVLHSTGELPSPLSIVLQGDAVIYDPVAFGDGLRCTGGNLKRLYVKSAVNGQVDAPTGSDPSITVRSSALGDPISPGSTRYYQVYYRDPSVSFCAPPWGSTFNVTNGVRIVW